MNCDPHYLAQQAACFCFDRKQFDAVDLMLKSIVSGCPPPVPPPPIGNIVLGNPDTNIILGNPNTGVMFGIP